MTIITLHVCAKSKKAINDRLAQGSPVTGIHYTPYDENLLDLDANLADGTVIKIYEKHVYGSPFVKSYGTWNARALRVR